MHVVRYYMPSPHPHTQGIGMGFRRREQALRDLSEVLGSICSSRGLTKNPLLHMCICAHVHVHAHRHVLHVPVHVHYD